MKSLFCFIFILFLIVFVNAGEFSISPPQIDFEGVIKEEICGKFFITTSEESVLVGEDRWGEKEETRRKFSIHTLSSEELDLEVNYPELIESNGEIISEICILGKEEGNYHGLLLYRLEGSPTGIGIWLNVSLEKKSGSVLSLTGDVIGEEGVDLDGILIIVVVLLVLVLGVLVFRRRKRKLIREKI